MATSLGERLRAAREACEYRLQDIAIALHTTPATIARIENNEIGISNGHVAILCMVCGKDTQDLIDGSYMEPRWGYFPTKEMCDAVTAQLSQEQTSDKPEKVLHRA